MVALSGARGAGLYALVDDADHESVVAAGPWWLKRYRRKDGSYLMYALTRIGGRTVSMHTLLTGYPLTDHRNGDGLDNQRHNLRPATQSQNLANKAPSGGSEYMGVCWRERRRKWYAQIRRNGKVTHLGSFTDEVDAAKAYDAAAVEVHGEFARLNFQGRSANV